MLRRLLLLLMIVAALSHVLALPESRADDKKQTLQEMQKSLNQEVISQPFSVADEEKVKAYIADATKRGVAPAAQPGAHWRAGYTCHDLVRYSWHEYQECRYYHWYYGRYYR